MAAPSCFSEDVSEEELNDLIPEITKIARKYGLKYGKKKEFEVSV